MSQRTIFILVPYKARDFNGNALVAYYLEKVYGYNVILANSYGIEKKIRKYKPDMIVIDHAYWNFKADQIRFARKFGVKVALMPTEGLIFKDEVLTGNIGCDHQVNKLINLNFVWGNFHLDVYKRTGTSNEEQTKVVGCPRFDFYAAPYTQLLQSREEFNAKWKVVNPQGKNILWATNTPYFARDHKDVIQRYTTRSAMKEEAVRAFLHDEEIQFNVGCSFIREMAVKHPDWNFFIKIHPAEWPEPYEVLIKEFKNVYLCYNAQIHEFLVYADALIQRNCTTATEAWMVNKPVFQFEMGEYINQSTDFYLTGNDVVHSNQEAEALMLEYFNGKAIDADKQAVRDKFISDFYFRIDGKASLRIAQQMHITLEPPFYSDKQHTDTMEALKEEETRWMKAENGRMVNKFKDIFGIERDKSLRFLKRFKNRKKGSKLAEGEIEITPQVKQEAFKHMDNFFETHPELLGIVDLQAPTKLPV